MPAEEFTLSWQHSVQKTQWIEHYRVDRNALALVEARVQGSGAGMEPDPRATLRDGWWTWTPTMEPLRSLELSVSPYSSDYELCAGTRCRWLRDLAHADTTAVVSLRPCQPEQGLKPRP